MQPDGLLLNVLTYAPLVSFVNPLCALWLKQQTINNKKKQYSMFTEMPLPPSPPGEGSRVRRENAHAIPQKKRMLSHPLFNSFYPLIF
jgi:hypothetical protein